MRDENELIEIARDIAGFGVNHARLLPSMAERVVAFWKTRH